jgi:nucleoside-diphosphate-sugar epimerase
VLSSIELVDGDIRDKDLCIAACEGIDTVFHLAALGSVPRSIEDPITTNAVNITGTLNILTAARAANVQRVVFSSSSSVYGDTPVLPKHESMRPNPRSPYAVTKLAGEEYCRAFTRSYGTETVVLRYFNVFGPRQHPHSQYAAVIPRFLSALTEGRQPVLYGDGLQSRDFTYVDNVVHANLLAAQAPDVAGEVFNIACGEQIAVKQVLTDIAALLDCDAAPSYQPARPGDVLHSLADIESARQRLHFSPRIYFAEGLKETVRCYVLP